MVTETDTVGLNVRLLVRDHEGGPVRVDCTNDPALYDPEFIEELEALVCRFKRTSSFRPAAPAPSALSLL
jgi:hypothetical protein